jgi:hypothetical protein
MNVLTKDHVNTSCDECKRDVDAVVAIQGDGRYPIWVCLECIEKARTLLVEKHWVKVEGCGGFIYPRPPESDEKDNHWGTIPIDGNEVTFTPSCTVAHKEE